jgi:hypothetical protein
MHPACPRCGLVFGREPGYFVGAMYFSYALAVPVFALLAWGVHLLRPGWTLERDLAVAVAPFLLFVPPLFRCSRILWMYFDRMLDPPR